MRTPAHPHSPRPTDRLCISGARAAVATDRSAWLFVRAEVLCRACDVGAGVDFGLAVRSSKASVATA